MKKKKLVVILSVIAMLIGIVGIKVPVNAMEVSDISNYMEDDAQTLNQLYSSQANVYGEYADIPVFLLLFSSEEDSTVISAFYVRDTNGTGNTYLVTCGVADTMLREGYKLQVFRGDYSAEVTGVTLDSTGYFSFLEVTGLDNFEPMDITSNVYGSNTAFAFLNMDSNKDFYVDIDRFDVNDWEYSEGSYKDDSAEPIDNPIYLGAAAIDLNTNSVWGGIYATSELEPVIIDLNWIDFPESAAIVEGGSETEEPVAEEPATEEPATEEPVTEEPMTEEPVTEEPVTEEPAENAGGPSKWYVWGVIIGVMIVVFMKKSASKNKKPQSDNTVSDYTEGTIALETDSTDGLTERVEVQEIEQMFSAYQIRGLSGMFEGQVFGVNQLIIMGRTSECSIQFSPKTPGISGKHCQLEPEADGIVLRDLQSTYGTYHNGSKMTPQLDYHLKAGDQFYLGDKSQSFRVEIKGEMRQEFTPVVKAVVEPKAGEFYHADAEGRLAFGRSSNSQVKFEETNTAISTRHCVLYKNTEGLFLMDLGSTNGTFLDEKRRLQPHVPYRINKGNTFFLASQKYTFVITEE